MYLSAMQRKGEVNMGWMDDIKKGFKGSKEYQEAKAKKKKIKADKAKKQRAKLDALKKKSKAIKAPVSKTPKAKKPSFSPAPTVAERKARIAKSKAKRDTAGANKEKAKKTKQGLAAAGNKKANAKKAANKSWKKATASAKKAGGPGINTLVKARGMHKKGSPKYNAIQNKINEHYGVGKRHVTKSSGVGKLDRDKIAGKVKLTPKSKPKKKVAPKKPTVHKTMTPSKSDSSSKGKSYKKTHITSVSKSKYDKAKLISDDASERHKQMLEDEGMKVSKIKGGNKSYKGKSEYQKGVDKAKQITEDARKALEATQKKEQGGMVNDMRPQYKDGGKVKGGGLFDFPSSPSRKK